MPLRSSTPCSRPASARVTEQGTADPARRRWRRGLLALALGALAAVALLAWLTRPATVLSILQRQLAHHTGLVLEARPVRFGWQSGLVVELHDLRLGLPGGQVLLRAQAASLGADWAPLFEPVPNLGLLRVEGAELDLGRLRHWLATRPAGDGGSAALRLRLELRDARLTDGERIQAEGLDADLKLDGDLAAWVRRLQAPDPTQLLPPASGAVRARRLRWGEADIEGLELDARD